ncbi:hypothetical protein P171DRAFT_488066 [Karstenula rhodostoma CBS 690.94]|uniref:Uncharacterized protein n=1 Tax=Karstenula rhodostoma CBS 690.94 TaxID=1392251 RepID=A0A9P4PCW4_9PLEO|nr:hypothetical protein P171DRAFT_488066 [Karstenula rhodostoma CBS 690.94]
MRCGNDKKVSSAARRGVAGRHAGVPYRRSTPALSHRSAKASHRRVLRYDGALIAENSYRSAKPPHRRTCHTGALTGALTPAVLLYRSAKASHWRVLRYDGALIAENSYRSAKPPHRRTCHTGALTGALTPAVLLYRSAKASHWRVLRYDGALIPANSYRRTHTGELIPERQAPTPENLPYRRAIPEAATHRRVALTPATLIPARPYRSRRPTPSSPHTVVALSPKVNTGDTVLGQYCKLVS